MSKIDDNLGAPEEHESYGMLGFSRISCGGAGCTLFGSSIRHGNYIRLKIARATLRRNLSRDSYFADGRPLIEVEMSLSQFAEAITGLNIGDGVPCTIHSLDGVHAEEPPYKSKRQQFEDEFKEDCAEVATRIDDLESYARGMLSKSSVTKGERAELIEMIRMLRQQVASNMPFVASQFNRQMDRTVREAKGEVEAFVMNRVVNAGLDALGSRPLLAIEED